MPLREEDRNIARGCRSFCMCRQHGFTLLKNENITSLAMFVFYTTPDAVVNLIRGTRVHNFNIKAPPVTGTCLEHMLTKRRRFLYFSIALREPESFIKRKDKHSSSIKINQATRCISFPALLLVV
jgi:hypothetical protein